MRNLTKAIAAVSLLVPASAYPLGIGEIKLHSALNQKLDAEIALLISAGESISDVKVRLAPPEKFDEAGVPWSYFLSKIKFKAITLPNGASVVKLTSNEALREPFLDFLLEVTWATGNMYREFTVLVDPPATYAQPIIPVIQKPQQQPQQSERRYVASQPEKTSNKHVQTFNTIADGQYGPTNRHDYLWKVAKRANSHSDVSVEQMMMAIYEANPKAFYKRNVNALMAGKILNIPDRDAILKLSKKQALAAYKQQDNEWRGRRSSKHQQPNIEEIEVATQLVLEAPGEDEIVESASSAVKGNAPVVDATISDSTVATSSSEGLAAIQAKMKMLEQQLGMMQKMLVLKDEQIAALQNKKPGETTIDPVIGSEKVKKEETEKQPKVTKATTPEKPTKTPVVVKKTPKIQKPIVTQPEPEEDSIFGYLTLVLGGLGAGLLGWLWWRKRNDEEELDSESMFASATEISLPGSSEDELPISTSDDGFSNFDASTEGESSFLSAFTPTDFDAFDTDETEVDPIAEADVYLAYGRYQQAEDLMRQAIEDDPDKDECKLKLLEIFHTNENKSSFEKYAEELVSEGKHEDIGFWAKVAEMGIELSPESPLFNVDKVALEKVSLEQTPLPTDEKEQTLGNDQALAFEENADEADFDLSVFDDSDSDIAKNVPKEEAKTATDDNALDFDLSVFDIDGSEDNVKSADIKTEEIETIDFDLNSLALDDSGQEDIKVDDLSTELEDDLDLESFELTLDDQKEESENKEEITVDSKVEIDDLSTELENDLDLDSLELAVDDKKVENDKKEEITVDLKAEVAEATETIEDFDFDFDAPPSSTEPVAVLDTGVSDLTDMDQMETKMDLAKAYIDMGDIQAAKDIVEEVMEKGSEDQKISAKELLEQLKKS